MDNTSFSAREAEKALYLAQRELLGVVCPDCLKCHTTAKIDLVSGQIAAHTSCSKSTPVTKVLGRTEHEVRNAINMLGEEHFLRHRQLLFYPVERLQPLSCRVRIDLSLVAIRADGSNSPDPSRVDVNFFYGLDSDSDTIRPTYLIKAIHNLFVEAFGNYTATMPIHTELGIYFGQRHVTIASTFPNYNHLSRPNPLEIKHEWEWLEFWGKNDGVGHFYHLLRPTNLFKLAFFAGHWSRKKSDLIEAVKNP